MSVASSTLTSIGRIKFCEGATRWESKDKVDVRKLLVWKTNKESDPRFPAYVVHWTDYSSTRKAPLTREVKLAVNQKDADALAESLIEENVKKKLERKEVVQAIKEQGDIVAECNKCGDKSNPAEAKFCSKCGTAIGSASKSSKPTSETRVTFISEDVEEQLNKYTFAERCEILADLHETPSEDEDLAEWFNYEDESMTLAHNFVNLNAKLNEEEEEIINIQFGHYILLINGWHN